MERCKLRKRQVCEGLRGFATKSSEPCAPFSVSTLFPLRRITVLFRAAILVQTTACVRLCRTSGFLQSKSGFENGGQNCFRRVWLKVSLEFSLPTLPAQL